MIIFFQILGNRFPCLQSKRLKNMIMFFQVLGNRLPCFLIMQVAEEKVFSMRPSKTSLLPTLKSSDK